MTRWVLHESGWHFVSNGAPAAQLMDGDRVLRAVTWSRSRMLTFEAHGLEAVVVPIAVLKELVARAERWHWRHTSPIEIAPPPGPPPPESTGRR